MSQELFQTPLYGEHLKLSAKMVDFAGWLMPVSYTSIVSEHNWTRENASLFDICHMGEFVVEGGEADAFLDYLITSRIKGLEVGQCRYGLLLNDNAGILDDLIVYRIEENRFMLVVNAATKDRDFQWFSEHIRGFDAMISDVSDSIAKIDIQGPRSAEILSEFLKQDLSGIGYFRFRGFPYKDEEIIVSRTGYTGELGFELYVPSESAVGLWQDLLESPLLRPAGLGARDTLRLEMGYPLYGQDMDETKNPIEASMERFVYWDKDFIGRNALLEIKRKGVSRRLIGITSESRRPFRHNDKVFSVDDREVGVVTSGSFSPSLKKAIGLAYIDMGIDYGDNVLVKGKAAIEASVCAYPFYKHGSLRSKVC